jgi:hypothetical protein
MWGPFWGLFELASLEGANDTDDDNDEALMVALGSTEAAAGCAEAVTPTLRLATLAKSLVEAEVGAGELSLVEAGLCDTTSVSGSVSSTTPLLGS